MLWEYIFFFFILPNCFLTPHQSESFVSRDKFEKSLDLLNPSKGVFDSIFLFQYVIPLCVISFAYVHMSMKLWGARAPGNALEARDANHMRNKKKVTVIMDHLYLKDIKLSCIYCDDFGGVCWVGFESRGGINDCMICKYLYDTRTFWFYQYLGIRLPDSIEL